MGIEEPHYGLATRSHLDKRQGEKDQSTATVGGKECGVGGGGGVESSGVGTGRGFSRSS